MISFWQIPGQGRTFSEVFGALLKKIPGIIIALDQGILEILDTVDLRLTRKGRILARKGLTLWEGHGPWIGLGHRGTSGVLNQMIRYEDLPEDFRRPLKSFQSLRPLWRGAFALREFRVSKPGQRLLVFWIQEYFGDFLIQGPQEGTRWFKSLVPEFKALGATTSGAGWWRNHIKKIAGGVFLKKGAHRLHFHKPKAQELRRWLRFTWEKARIYEQALREDLDFFNFRQFGFLIQQALWVTEALGDPSLKEGVEDLNFLWKSSRALFELVHWDQTFQALQGKFPQEFQTGLFQFRQRGSLAKNEAYNEWKALTQGEAWQGAQDRLQARYFEFNQDLDQEVWPDGPAENPIKRGLSKFLQEVIHTYSGSDWAQFQNLGTQLDEVVFWNRVHPGFLHKKKHRAWAQGVLGLRKPILRLIDLIRVYSQVREWGPSSSGGALAQGALTLWLGQRMEKQRQQILKQIHSKETRKILNEILGTQGVEISP